VANSGQQHAARYFTIRYFATYGDLSTFHPACTWAWPAAVVAGDAAEAEAAVRLRAVAAAAVPLHAVAVAEVPQWSEAF